MNFKAQMALDAKSVFLNAEEFGEAARYFPAAGGPELDATVILDQGNSLEAGAIGSNPASVATIRTLSSQIPDPQIDDIVTISRTGDAWRVVRVMSRADGIDTLEAVMDARMGMHR